WRAGPLHLPGHRAAPLRPDARLRARDRGPCPAHRRGLRAAAARRGATRRHRAPHARPPHHADPARCGDGDPHRRGKRMKNMFTARNKGRLAIGAVAVGAALALSGCTSGDPLDPGTGDGDGDGTTIVVGSQAYYSNEIIAEIYAQALENAGFTVERNFNIGQRDAYIPAIENGSIDLFPEYTGNLLQFYAPDTTATTPDDVYAELKDALPDGLTVLDQSPATDQDSYNVTKAFADQYGLTSIADLASVDVPVVLGGAPELEQRPYGPSGLKDLYGVTVQFQATGDTTVEDLV